VYDIKESALQLAQSHNFNVVDALLDGHTYQDILNHLAIKESNQDRYLELLLCPPKYMSASITNNEWMERLPEEDRQVNVDKAMAQFQALYSLFSQDAIVYLLPPKKGLQDQVYITNAGMVLPHLYKTIILSKFKAEGRPGEEIEVAKFMEMMDYQQVFCPYYFEGEAELKWLRDNIYIGGYGQRTDINAHEWLEREFNCQIVKIKETDKLRYHLDCNIFCLNREVILFAKDQVKSHELKEMEKVAECIPIDRVSSQWSLTNSLRIGSIIYNGTDISELKKDDKNYPIEKKKNEDLEKICQHYGLELVFVNMSEFSKSGAALSCCILHLNYIGYPK
jgi:arginine dihydrolase